MERVARFRVERTLCANTFLKFFVVVFSDAESSFKGIQTPAYRGHVVMIHEERSERTVGGCVYFRPSFLMGLLVEGITSFQIWIRPHLGKGRPRKIVMSILYSMQQWLGYLVMMITMMYSIELFASLLVGLVVGRVLFLPRSTTAPKINTTRTTTASSSENNGSNTSAEETPLLERHPSIRRRRR